MINKGTYTYKDWVHPVQKEFIRIDLPSGSEKELEPFVKRLMEKKIQENNYISDPEDMEKRFTTGYGAEMAVGVMLGMNILDKRIGDARDFAIGDLSTIGLPYTGIKAIEYDSENNKFPVVNKLAIDSEIIVFKQQKKQSYLISGLATPDYIRTYSDRSLIWNDAITQNKVCFYGIKYCKPITSYGMLKKYNDYIPIWRKQNNLRTSDDNTYERPL